MPLLADKATVPLPTSSPPPMHMYLQAFSAYYLPSVEALVWYFLAAAGFPVQDNRIREIQARNFKSCPGLTLQNTTKYCPISKETMKGHMVQKRQNIGYTKHKHKKPIALRPPKPVSIPTYNEIHIRIQHIIKLYTDDTGKFLVLSRSGNQYNMVAYHCDSNNILAVPFTSKKYQHRLRAYDEIMQRLTDRGMIMDLQILDNKASAANKHIITIKWGVAFQLVPPPTFIGAMPLNVQFGRSKHIFFPSWPA